MHPSISATTDYVMKNKVVLPGIQLAKEPGSRFDISMDVTGQLEAGQVSLSIENSSMIIHRYAVMNNMPFAKAKKVSIEDINNWLQENEVNVMVTRYPVPHVGGAYMARVMSLHKRKGIIDMHVNDIRLRLEGDGDGDEVQVELLRPGVEAVYKPYLDSIPVEGVNLSRFIKTQKKHSLSDNSSRLNLIVKATTGRKAIGEITNVMTVYSIMSRVYESFSDAGGLIITPKNSTSKISFPQAVFNGVKGSWDGNVKQYLRLWLQAAVDNAEFGLLAEWGYKPKEGFGGLSGQEKLYMKLFNIASISAPNMVRDLNFQDTQTFLWTTLTKNLIAKHKLAGYIRRGSDFNTGQYSLMLVMVQ